MQLTKGPEPVAGKQWCTVCALLLKGEANIQAGDQVKEAEAKGIDVIVDVGGLLKSQPQDYQLNYAVTTGIPLVFGPPPLGNGLINGIVPVCWQHCAGVQMINGVAPANPQEVAAFGGGGAVPLLGQGRRAG